MTHSFIVYGIANYFPHSQGKRRSFSGFYIFILFSSSFFQSFFIIITYFFQYIVFSRQFYNLISNSIITFLLAGFSNVKCSPLLAFVSINGVCNHLVFVLFPLLCFYHLILAVLLNPFYFCFFFVHKFIRVIFNLNLSWFTEPPSGRGEFTEGFGQSYFFWYCVCFTDCWYLCHFYIFLLMNMKFPLPLMLLLGYFWIICFWFYIF